LYPVFARDSRSNTSINLSMKEKVSDEDSGDNAGQVGDNAGRDRISSISNVHRSEIHSEYIKSCFCTAPENSCQVADEAVGSEIIRMRYVQHHPAGRSAAQGFKQCHGKGIDKVCVNAEEREHAADSADDIIQGTRCTK